MNVVQQKLVSDSAEAQVKFEQLLQIHTQFKCFVLKMEQNHPAEFLSFNMNTDRLDEFYWNYRKDAKHSKMWEVFRIIFTLSHSLAGVKGGFSVNSELLVENLQEETLVASRSVCSSVKSDANHFSELSFSSRLKRNVRAARMRISCIKKSKRNFMLKAKKWKAVEDEIGEV